MPGLEMMNDDARFDRLVDGQLPPDEYRTMLAGFDDEPNGWRRCALAFLEAQALDRELGAVRDEKVQPVQAVALIADSAAPRSTRNLQMALALAACFLVAFGLGIALRTTWTVEENADNMVAEETPRKGGSPRGQGEGRQDSAPDVTHPLEDERYNDSPVREPLRNVTLVVGEDETRAQRIELPVVYYGDVGDEYFASEHSAMPPQMRQMLKRSGHRLQRTQRFVPLEMGDGQQVVVPVEEVEIVPVGLPAF